jgi:metacaspase-1
MDNTICPVDFKQAGQIVDDDMNAIVVRGLPPCVRLTSIFDCCHSGSALDLPFTYHIDGSIKTNKNALARLGSGGKEIAMKAMRGYTISYAVM